MSPISVLAHLWPYECSTEPQLLRINVLPTSVPLSLRQGGELDSLCSFCTVFCKASISAPQADDLRAHPERDVVIRSKGQNGILWTCQYVVNMETACTSETGMACSAHVHCSYSAEVTALLAQTVSLHFLSVKIEIMLSSLLFEGWYMQYCNKTKEYKLWLSG